MKRVLIIDDEKDMQVYLSTLFRKAGYEPLVACDGDEGLRCARETRPDLITLDILMPRQSGVIAYDALRAAPETRDIPVVVLSGLGDQVAAGLGDGRPAPAAVVDKPIDREAFLATIRELLGE